jgi:hypothetical protein
VACSGNSPFPVNTTGISIIFSISSKIQKAP